MTRAATCSASQEPVDPDERLRTVARRFALNGDIAVALGRTPQFSADRLARSWPSTGSFVDIALRRECRLAMPGLYGRFQNPVPTAILALDYLDREAEFRSLAHQPELVAPTVRQLSRTWVLVRPKVVAAGGEREAAAYQAHVAAMQELSPAAAGKVQAEAARGLELVDRLEHVFSR